MIWDILNSIGRFALTAIAVILVTKLRDLLNTAERAGLGAMGGGSFLTIGVIWEHQQSPFDGWSVTLLTYGAVVFLSGFAFRKLRHERRNAAAIRGATQHLAGRGKL